MKTTDRTEICLLPYQKRLMSSDKRFQALIGGTGTGKTWFLPRWLMVRMMRKPGEQWIVSSPTEAMLKRGPVAYIRDCFQEYGVPHTLRVSDGVIVTPYGVIHTISAENPDRMQGVHAAGIVGDEAGLFSRDWWDTAIQRTAFKRGSILLTTTPYGINWLKSEVYDRWQSGDTDYHVENPTSADNPFYPKEAVEQARRSLPEWRFQMLFQGQFVRPVGLVYPDVRYVEPFPVPADWKRLRGLDFGFNNPSAIVWIAVSPSGEMFITREFLKTGCIAEDLYEVLKDEPDIPTYADPASRGELELLFRRGIRVIAAKKEVRAGILAVSSLLRGGNLAVFSTLSRIRQEFGLYRWKQDMGESLLDEPVKEHDHLMDALRYAVFTGRSQEDAAPAVRRGGAGRSVRGVIQGY